MKLYELDINGEDTEVYFNSIVSIPAHLKASMKFKGSEKPIKFHFNDEKQIVTGVVIAVDEPIYRYNPDTKEEFNVVFRKAAATKILHDYMKKGYANNLNLEHSKNKVSSAYLFESYQVDSDRGNSIPEGFKSQNLQDGSIIFSYKIEDKEEWELVKSKGGFSIEGFFDMIEVTNKKEDKMSLLKKIGLSKDPDQKMTSSFKKDSANFAEATLVDGETIVMWDGELSEGVELFVDVEGVLTPAPDGVHALGGDMEGTSVEVADGVVIAVSEADESNEEDLAKESDVTEALSAIKEDYDSKFSAIEEKLNKKNDEIKSVKEEFEAFKNSSLAKFSKQKFESKKAESKKGKDNDDFFEKVKNAIK